MLSKKLENALNAQINAEFWSAFLYLSMACHFEANGRNGIANWFKVQFKEEQAHAELLMDYLHARGGKVELAPIAGVPGSWSDEKDAFNATLEHEVKVTKMINDLYALAVEEKDYPTQIKLEWFVSEQVEEEENVRHLIDTLNIIDGNGAGLYQFDRELAARTYVAPKA